jgi:ferredoxin--NADP+ reductase
MTHVITGACCNDAACTSVCPVNCIHPTPTDPDFLTAEMLYIDPDSCIDCGACVAECPVDAIAADDELMPSQRRRYLDLNAGYFRDRELMYRPAPARPVRTLREGPVAVAVVGAGPAGHYVTQELLGLPGVVVDMFDRLPTPYGLVRAGVAPDHGMTKKVETNFREVASADSFAYLLNVEVGRDITPEELRTHYSAVIYAHGAPEGRTLGVPGEGLSAVATAAEFISWYNGHPDFADRQFALDSERAVVVGNGNVALDVARILVGDVDALARTDIADHALQALRGSRVREVTVLGRRGVADAAYTSAEFAALLDSPSIDVVIDPAELVLDASARAARENGSLAWAVESKVALAEEASKASSTDGHKRIVFRYLSSVRAVTDDRGGGAVVEVVRNAYAEDGSVLTEDEAVPVPAGLVLSAVGYRGRPLVGVPFDEIEDLVPNREGRVLDGADGQPIAGVYVTGWAKRGPAGGIGRNRHCASETAASVLDDAVASRLQVKPSGRADVRELLASRGIQAVDRPGWLRIDDAEMAAGAQRDRTRVKVVDRAMLLSLAGPPG